MHQCQSQSTEKAVLGRKPFSDTKQAKTVNECKLVNDNKHKIPISVMSNNRQGFNTEKCFSKNRFAPLNDIIPRSECDDQKVLVFKQTDNNNKGRTNIGHKVGIECGERHTIIDSISKSHVTKSPMKNSLWGKDALRTSMNLISDFTHDIDKNWQGPKIMTLLSYGTSKIRTNLVSFPYKINYCLRLTHLQEKMIISGMTMWRWPELACITS